METYQIENEFLKLTVLPYGARIQKLEVKKENKWIDVCLGYDTLEEYQKDTGTYFGAVVGRVANRIENGKFTLNGISYQVATNDNTNHLHGGNIGFDKKIYKLVSKDATCLKLSLESQDGEENYPGNFILNVTYRLNNNELVLTYDASSDKDTLCNITNHTYFNLNGHDSGDILDHEVMLNASHYTPVKANLIPTGEIASVKNTPFNFLNAKKIKDAFDFKNTQIQYGKGIDHNFVLDSNDVGYAIGNKSHIKMEVKTTCPGMQFYTGNYLDIKHGKSGVPYNANAAFCFETQLFPDAINQKNFTPYILKKGEKYHQETKYIFS